MQDEQGAKDEEPEQQQRHEQVLYPSYQAVL